MSDTVMTDRQRRELEFYEEFSKLNEPAEVCFDPISGAETRPWNSYWRAYELVQQNFTGAGQRLLDFGCGPGYNAAVFAKIGYEVFGFDLSPNNISIAGRLAEKYGLADRTHFSVSAAEQLDYEDEYFDLVVGIDILHHVNIQQAVAECARVLKRGGRAIFHEPVRVPIFDTLRETSLGRWLVPKEASLNLHITHDERKLTPDDLKVLRAFDPALTAERFLLFSRLDRFIPQRAESAFLAKMDSRLRKAFPFLQTYGGIVVLVLQKQ